MRLALSGPASLVGAGFALALTLAAMPGQDQALLHIESIEMGRHLFFEETFRGNGRTCATCHVTGSGSSITPELIRAIFERDPTHPLFRPIDSDDGSGRSYSLLLEHGLFRVQVPLHPNVRLADEPQRRTLELRRSVPSIANVALTAPYQWDGRAPDLESQALGAVADHFEAGRQPRPIELRALARFQEQLFAPPLLAALLDPSDPSPMPGGFSLPLSSQAALRGREHFAEHCATCHSGELANEPIAGLGGRFQSSLVSDENRIGLPLLRLIFSNPDGTEQEASTPDPGLAALTGRRQDLNRFEVPSLRGIKHTAPYFHDNSAKSLGEVIDHYNLSFGFDLLGRRREEILAFLEAQ